MGSTVPLRGGHFSRDNEVTIFNTNGAVETFAGFVGMSPPMQNIYQQIEQVAQSRATVFVTGESGTGKEVCAEAIHSAGARSKMPFTAINCGAIPADLLESELFGHVKGSFTGAVADRIGAVQSAQGGTLFLDEICEMELRLQVKLLRFLQTGTVQRVGAARTEAVDVRIICATNRNPEAAVAAGIFREDLYYRLAVLPIEMPPLRARGHDIVLLANAFLGQFSNEENKTFNRVGIEFGRLFSLYHWPGNVRELQNMMRRAAVMFDGPDLPLNALAPKIRPLNTVHEVRAETGIMGFEGLRLDEIERLAIEKAIAHAGGSLPIAARSLGVSPSTLYRKRERWNLPPCPFQTRNAA